MPAPAIPPNTQTPLAVPNSMGSPLAHAAYVFVLPNPPQVVAEQLDSHGHLAIVNAPELIALNGNHWRKILTIIAKLVSPELSQWKHYRDLSGFAEVTFLFKGAPFDTQAKVFVVGKQLRQSWPIPASAMVLSTGEIMRLNDTIWCPYLDYRQFPNRLINELRSHLFEPPK